MAAGEILINNFWPVDPTGGSDSSGGLQAAINWAMNCALTQRLVLLPGQYRLDAPLMIAKLNGGGTDYDFVSGVDFGGSCAGFGGTGSALPVVAQLVTSYKDRPGIIVQMGRRVRLHDLRVTGKNEISGNFSSEKNLLASANFLAPGVRADANSPHAGICVDPFASGIGALHQYPGMSAAYVGAGGGTTTTIIERCTVDRFAVGLMLSPAPGRANGEDLICRDTRFDYNQTHIACGQDQLRNISLINPVFTHSEYCVNCDTYGSGIGVAPNIYGGSATWSKYLFQLAGHMDRGGFSCQGLYAESVLSLGRIGSGSNRNWSAHLSGCTFNLYSLARPIDYHALFSTTTLFSGCQFWTDGDVMAPLSFVTTTPSRVVTFEGCSFEASSVDSPQIVMNELTGFQFRGCKLMERSASVNTRFGQTVMEVVQSELARKTVLPGAMLQTQDQPAPLFVSPMFIRPPLEGDTLRVFDGLGGCLLSGLPGGYVAQLRIGDLIVDLNNWQADGVHVANGGYYGRVAAFNAAAGTVTLEMVPVSASANGALHIYRLPRFHRATTGDLSAGSPAVSNVSNPGDWAVGDPVRSGGHFQDGSYVAGMSGSTFTVSRASDATVAGARLYDADAYTPTLTPV